MAWLIARVRSRKSCRSIPASSSVAALRASSTSSGVSTASSGSTAGRPRARRASARKSRSRPVSSCQLALADPLALAREHQLQGQERQPALPRRLAQLVQRDSPPPRASRAAPGAPRAPARPPRRRAAPPPRSRSPRAHRHKSRRRRGPSGRSRTFGGVIAKVEPLTPARALRGPFDYRLAGALEGVGVGSMLVVPFGRRRLLGVVVELAERSELPPERLVQPLAALEADVPEPLVRLGLWVAREYVSTPARGLALVLPPGTGTRGRAGRCAPAARSVRRSPTEGRGGGRVAAHGSAVARRRCWTRSRPGRPRWRRVARHAGADHSTVRSLERRGLVRLENAAEPARRPSLERVGARAGAVEPTAAQRAALEAIVGAPAGTAAGRPFSSTASPAAARPRSTCARSPPRSSGAAPRSCSCPRSRSRRRRRAASWSASATRWRSCTPASRRASATTSGGACAAARRASASARARRSSPPSPTSA